MYYYIATVLYKTSIYIYIYIYIGSCCTNYINIPCAFFDLHSHPIGSNAVAKVAAKSMVPDSQLIMANG